MTITDIIIIAFSTLLIIENFALCHKIKKKDKKIMELEMKKFHIKHCYDDLEKLYLESCEKTTTPIIKK